MDSKTTLFLEYKPLLFSMAYNMLGGIDAAEDIVQDAYLKWMEAGEIQHPKAFLVKMVTNTAINHLNSARVRREKYMGVWLPEPLQQPEINESYHALSFGLMVVLERLTPRERAVFLLKEIFAYDYGELSEIFDITADNCRQVMKRAKTHLGKDTRRFKVDIRAHEKILQNFLRALRNGSLEELIDLLKEDIILYADSGGTAVTLGDQRLTAVLKPVTGRDKVTRLLLHTAPKFQQLLRNFRQEMVIASGLPAILTYVDELPFSLMSIEPDGEQIRHIYIQANPNKLIHFKQA